MSNLKKVFKVNHLYMIPIKHFNGSTFTHYSTAVVEVVGVQKHNVSCRYIVPNTIFHSCIPKHKINLDFIKELNPYSLKDFIETRQNLINSSDYSSSIDYYENSFLPKLNRYS